MNQNLKVNGRRVDLTVVLSNHFVRYALLPWSESLETPEEEQAYARHQFTRIYGERAAAWDFRSSAGGAGGLRLASAIDAGLLAQLHDSLAGPAIRLVSVQPGLMAVFNRHRRAVPAEGAWLLLLEPGRACIALHARPGWQAVHNAKLHLDGPDEWLGLLERERRRVGGELPDLVLIHSPGTTQPIPEAPGWRFQVLSDARAH